MNEKLRIEYGGKTGNTVEVILNGRISASTAEYFGSEIDRIHFDDPEASLSLDMSGVELLSCGGIRVLMRFLRDHYDFVLHGVNHDVYMILRFAGLTSILDVEKKVGDLSVEGCTLLGRGANGGVYRLDNETVVKVFEGRFDMDAVMRERTLAKKAFVAGVPTAISFGLANVGGNPGLVFELINAKSLAKLIGEDGENIGRYVDAYADAVRKIHAIGPEKLTDLPVEYEKDNFLSKITFLDRFLDRETSGRLSAFFSSLPDCDTLIHGDIQPNNLMVTDGGLLFIDMDSLAKGSAVFDLAYLYRTVLLYWETGDQKKFLSFDRTRSTELWERFVRAYCGTDDPEVITGIERQCAVIGFVSICCKLCRDRTGEDITNRMLLKLSEALADWEKKSTKQ